MDSAHLCVQYQLIKRPEYKGEQGENIAVWKSLERERGNVTTIPSLRRRGPF